MKQALIICVLLERIPIDQASRRSGPPSKLTGNRSGRPTTGRLNQMGRALAAAFHSAVADLPATLDPRSDDQAIVQGSCYVLHPLPLSSNYLIVTIPLDRNLKHEWFTVEATADPSLKVDAFTGQFVHIEATRIKPTSGDAAPLKITSIRPITKW